MGNVNKVQQKIEQTVENHLDSTGHATAETDCNQEVVIEFDGVDLRNCSTLVEQNCKAKSAISMTNMLEAVQDTTWKGENKQVAKGIAFQVNSSSTKSDSITKAINKIKKKCSSKSYAEAFQTVKLSYKNMTIDCSENPDAILQNIRQYGSTEANCMMSQILKNYQKYESEIKNDQENKGLELGGSIILLLVAAAGIFMIKFKSGGGRERNYGENNY
jgi:hypothetical protein